MPQFLDPIVAIDTNIVRLESVDSNVVTVRIYGLSGNVVFRAGSIPELISFFEKYGLLGKSA